MPCFKPIQVPKRGFVDLRVTVPCGQCIGCRIDRTEDWTTRIMHEVKLHDLCQFVTLTYCDRELPAGGSLVKSDFQLFIKRLRSRHDGKLRYFGVGEYGDQLGRPHYHAILFGIDFSDKRPHSKNENGDQLFTSDLLDEIWGHGHAFFGAVTVQSARYVAKYCIKKVNGSLADEHYGGRQPEFAVMSLKPGIGAGWFHQNQGDVYPSDFVVLNGKKRSPPRFYDVLLARQDEVALEDIKSNRVSQALKHRDNQTPDRLRAREICATARSKLFKGKL